MSLAKDFQLLTNPPPPAIIPSDKFLSDEPQLETHLHMEQQQLADVEALLARYREQFGQLSD
ncbi:MAG: hypothetical protein F6K14_29835 [Symploca sp. SIO2C1]|nr:hypothetical protein [Symploca sp. SIO2C1]